MSNYIYKMINKNNEIIYIGKTINIDQRLRQHMMDKDKKWFKTVSKIYYAECLNKTDMDIYEIYYINKLNPLHNKQSVNNCEFSQILNELNFVESSFNIKVELKKINKKMKEKRMIKENNQTNNNKLCCEINNEYTQYYTVGNDFVEKDVILELYKTNKEISKEWIYLLDNKQFMVYKENPCKLKFFQFDVDDIELRLYPFSCIDEYVFTLNEFIDKILDGSIVPLKYLDEDIKRKVNILRANCGTFNNMDVINKRKEDDE